MLCVVRTYLRGGLGTTDRDLRVSDVIGYISGLNRSERWVQIVDVLYVGYDLAAYGYSETKRRLELDAEAHQ